MFENSRRGRQARNFTTNAPKILVLKSSAEQIFSRKLPLGAPVIHETIRKYLLLLKEMSSISSNITSNTTRVKTGIKQHAKAEYCGARGTHITDPAQRHVNPRFFLLLLKIISSI